MTSKKQSKAVQLLQEAFAVHGAGRAIDALALYQRAIAANPELASAHEGRGIALAQLKRHDEALKSLNRAAGLDRANANILLNRGTVLNELGRWDDAIAEFEHVLMLVPSSAAACYGIGNALERLGRAEEALRHIDRALELRPRFPQALDARGRSLVSLARHDEALSCYGAALALDPNQAETWFNRGICLSQLRRFRDAVGDFYSALNIDPGDARFHLAAASACNDIGFAPDALTNVNRALELDPKNLEARMLRGIVLQGMQRDAEAIDDLDHVAEFQPEDGALHCLRETARRYIHSWPDDEASDSELRALLASSPTVPSPFFLLSMTADAEFQKSVASRYASRIESAAKAQLPPHPGHGRIRLGYFSADFHDHATMYLIADLLEKHDRSRFEVTAFSFGPDDKSKWRARAEASVERFIELRGSSDAEIARRARELQIDIALDLKGFTLHARPYLFAERAAPIQVNYLGYPGTMGCSVYDYIVADPVLIPPNHERFYSEKVVRLPDSYQPNLQTREVDPKPSTRVEAGLPDEAVVFCSFNQSYKLTRRIFEAWMEILRRVEGSVLWLWVKTDEAKSNLEREAAARGIDPRRIIFASTLRLPQHLARLPLADLFLDTRPYNAHTTASDALSRGVPIITWPGDSFASRVAASLLTAAGFPELIVSSLNEYVELAVALGRDQMRLARLKNQLASKIPVNSLFDSGLYARHFERALQTMYNRLMGGLPPDHIDVQRTTSPSTLGPRILESAPCPAS